MIAQMFSCVALSNFKQLIEKYKTVFIQFGKPKRMSGNALHTQYDINNIRNRPRQINNCRTNLAFRMATTA